MVAYLTQNWPLQRDCDGFYGNPRGADGGASSAWEKANLVFVTAPWPLRMGDIALPKGIRIHKLAAESLKRVLARIWDAAGQDLAVIKRWGMDDTGGGYNFRRMRGGSALSMHSWGCAVDFDPDRNGLGDKTPAMAREVIAAFEAEGWEWGGHWDRCDGMHFQAAWTRAKPKRLADRVDDEPRKPAAPKTLDRMTLETYQRQLQRLGYTEVGKIDGLMGSRTVAAITAFQTVEGLPVSGAFDAATVARLGEAGPRPISTERAGATAKDLVAAGHETVTNAVGMKKLADYAMAGATAVGGAAASTGGDDPSSAVALLGSAPDTLQRAADGAQTAISSAGVLWRLFGPAYLWIMAHPLLVAAVVAVVVLYLVRRGAVKTITAAVDRYRTGADTGENVGG